MTDSSPAAALDLDAIRADIERAGRACCIETCTNDVAEAQAVRTVAQQHAPALLAELESTRRELFILHSSEDAEVTMVEVQRDKALADLAEAHTTIRAFVDDLDGGEWTTRQGWMNGDRFQTYTSSAEGFLPPTGPTHQQRIWTGPVEEIEQVARG